VRTEFGWTGRHYCVERRKRNKQSNCAGKQAATEAGVNRAQGNASLVKLRLRRDRLVAVSLH